MLDHNALQSFIEESQRSLEQFTNLQAQSILKQYSWHQNSTRFLFEQITSLMQAIELDQMKWLSKSPSSSTVQKWKMLLNCIQLVQNSPPLPMGYLISPYIKAFVQQVSQITLNPNWNNQPIDVVKQIQTALYAEKAGLKATAYKEKINTQLTIQNRYFDQILRKHKHINCFFLEIPYSNTTYMVSNTAMQQYESSFPPLLKKFFLALWQNRDFDKKLCDIQWRIVKGLDGTIIAQILIYFVSDISIEARELRRIWKVCCSELLPYIKDDTLYIHPPMMIYKEHALAKKQWKDLLKNYHKPLEYYHYKSSNITYEWKSYTGNI